MLACFSERRPVMTISTVAAESGLTRATARRILHTLVQLGFVAADGDHFRLTPRVLSIGHSYLSSLALPELAHPWMERLVDTLHESSSLAVLDGCETVCVAQVGRATSHPLTVGTRLPAFATAIGRALLACLTDEELRAALPAEPFPRFTARTLRTGAELRDALAGVRSRGFAIGDEDLEEGLRAIAVPIRGPRGRAEAALNVAVAAERVGVDDLRTGMLPQLRAAAAAIESGLRSAPARHRDARLGAEAVASDREMRVSAS